MKKTLRNILLAGTIMGNLLTGCREVEPYFEKNVAKYNGYDVMIHKGQISIGNLKNDDPDEGFEESVTAYFDSNGNLTGEISFKGKEGSNLEKFTNIGKIREIYKEINERRN